MKTIFNIRCKSQSGEKMRFLDETWCGLEWSPWYPLMEGRSLDKGLGKGPGIYRIRVVGEDRLAYIGQTGRCLRENLTRLREESGGKRVDPDSKHFASPCMFVYLKVKDAELEVSTCPMPKIPEEERLVTESFLLWNYRLEARESPLCNLKRFHDGFDMFIDPREGVKVRKLNADESRDNSSISPLKYDQPFEAKDWMGLLWSEWVPLDKKAAKAEREELCFFRIAKQDMSELLLVDWTEDLGSTLAEHLREKWSKKTVYSVAFRGLELPAAHVAELRNDMVAGYYMERSEAPVVQYKIKPRS